MNNRKSKYLAGILLILILLIFMLFEFNVKEENNSVTICTEEALSYVVDDMIQYFNDTRETPVDFQVTYIPMDETQRAGVCKRLRTELMTGKRSRYLYYIGI